MYSYLTKCPNRRIRTFSSPFTLSIVNSSYRWCRHPDCPPLVLKPLPCCPRFVRGATLPQRHKLATTIMGFTWRPPAMYPLPDTPLANLPLFVLPFCPNQVPIYPNQVPTCRLLTNDYWLASCRQPPAMYPLEDAPLADPPLFAPTCLANLPPNLGLRVITCY